MNVAITGGGTGGHLAIAKALKEAFLKKGIKPIYIGSTYGQDEKWFGMDDDWEKCYFFETSGVVNKRGLAKIASVWSILKAMIKAGRLLQKHKIEVVFSVGGYSAAPASFAAVLLGKSFYMHEQNAVMGKLNRLLAPRAKALFSSYHDSVLGDYPVREVFFDKARVREEIKCVIFLGGSQGASAINDFALGVAERLDGLGIKMIHQCGEKDLHKCEAFYHDRGIEADVFSFSTQIDVKISEADFAVCRAGAGTVWELTASGLPALYVPYPHAAGNHQYHNAKFLVDKEVAFLSLQDDLDVDVIDLMLHANVKEMSQSLISLLSRGGADKIVEKILV